MPGAPYGHKLQFFNTSRCEREGEEERERQCEGESESGEKPERERGVALALTLTPTLFLVEPADRLSNPIKDLYAASQQVMGVLESWIEFDPSHKVGRKEAKAYESYVYRPLLASVNRHQSRIHCQIF